MQFFSFFLIAAFTVSIARCAPAVNSATFSDNALKAQALNAKFLNATDQCQGDETACIGGNIMKCQGGKFEISEQCTNDRECFAIPNIQSPGTSLVCTTERNAESLINAANVDGGITGSGNNSTSTSSTSSGTSSTSSTASPSGIPVLPNRNDPPAVVTVTVTEFADPRSTTTTSTLSPSGTSSISNNPLAGGLPPATSSSSVPPLTPAADPSSTPTSSSGPSIIILSAAGGGATNPTPSPSVTSPSPILLSAVAEEPTPGTPTPAPSPSGPPNIPVGGGGGGYYS